MCNINLGYTTKSGGIVIGYDENSNRKNAFVKCSICDNVESMVIKTIKSRPCYCSICYTRSGLRKNRFIGQRFGKLVVKEFCNKRDSEGRYLYLCLCDCGRMKELSTQCFNKNQQSCGCLVGNSNKERYDLIPKSNRKTRDVNGAIWRQLVKYIIHRDKKCILCDGEFKLTPHHLDGWNWCNEKRYDETNLVLICNYYHEDFHSKYLKGNNTKEQFLEYVKNYHLEEYFDDILSYKITNGFEYTNPYLRTTF